MFFVRWETLSAKKALEQKACAAFSPGANSLLVAACYSIVKS